MLPRLMLPQHGRSTTLLIRRKCLPVFSHVYHNQQIANYKSAPGKIRVQDPLIGDYPNLPFESRLNRPALGWDDQQSRINFDEPIHEEEDALSVWSLDIYNYKNSTALKSLGIFFSSVGLFGIVIAKTMPENPTERRTYPYEGLRVELGSDPLNPEDKSQAAPSED
ncbi:6707_t:CDS:2 [Funneliformis caledonium]|uniref:6707_t:CDS:1 n=1 Tax=Funneliformis caledonium TaxID=1117310 RepID=A0A9N9A8P2_9GLOM|nr:6707_t:CDS:2 [Funneliformis caledonium]